MPKHSFFTMRPYNGNTEHDMWVDFDNYENTGIPDVFYKTELKI